MKLVLLLTLVALAVWVPEAGAQETARGIARSAVIVRAPCPTSAEAVACAVAPARLIYEDGPIDSAIRRAVIQHERGHIFAFYAGGRIRKRAMVLLGYRSWREERFADSYAACHLSRFARERAAKNGGGVGLKVPKLCALL